MQDATTGVKVWLSNVQSTVSVLIEGARQVSDAQEKAVILSEYFCNQSKVNDRFASFPREPSFINNAILCHYYNGTWGSWST